MKTETNDVCKNMIDGAITSFRSNKGWADKAIAQLANDKLYVAIDSNTNSIAVIMKHVVGNLLSRWTRAFSPRMERNLGETVTMNLWTPLVHWTI